MFAGWAVIVLGALTALLGLYAVLKDLAADLVLLGGCLLILVAWGIEALVLVLAARDVAVPDPITLWGYVATGIALPIAGIWLGLGERSRWGSAAILIIAVTMIVLQMRLPQLWPGAFA